MQTLSGSTRALNALTYIFWSILSLVWVVSSWFDWVVNIPQLNRTARHVCLNCYVQKACKSFDIKIGSRSVGTIFPVLGFCDELSEITAIFPAKIVFRALCAKSNVSTHVRVLGSASTNAAGFKPRSDGLRTAWLNFLALSRTHCCYHFPNSVFLLSTSFHSMLDKCEASLDWLRILGKKFLFLHFFGLEIENRHISVYLWKATGLLKHLIIVICILLFGLTLFVMGDKWPIKLSKILISKLTTFKLLLSFMIKSISIKLIYWC